MDTKTDPKPVNIPAWVKRCVRTDLPRVAVKELTR